MLVLHFCSRTGEYVSSSVVLTAFGAGPATLGANPGRTSPVREEGDKTTGGGPSAAREEGDRTTGGAPCAGATGPGDTSGRGARTGTGETAGASADFHGQGALFATGFLWNQTIARRDYALPCRSTICAGPERRRNRGQPYRQELPQYHNPSRWRFPNRNHVQKRREIAIRSC